MTPLQERAARERKAISAEMKESVINRDIDVLIELVNAFNKLDEDPEAYFEEIDKIEE